MQPRAPDSPRFDPARIVLPAAALLTLLPFVSAGMGLALGLVLALALGNPYMARSRKATTTLLQIAVIGLGFGMDLRVVVRVGLHGIGTTLIGIAFCLLVGRALASLFRVRRDVATLVTVGTAICGGSAIAAIVPAIGANDEDATVSLAVVFVLNAVALLVFPMIGHAFGLGDASFGLWAALAIHDTSSVVGAASEYSAAALQIATTVKLTRALWIVPLALAIGAWRAREHRDRTASRAPAKKPWFILGFLAAAAIATFVPGMAPAGAVLSRVFRQVLVLTLFLVGANLSRASLRAVGLRPLALGVVLWANVAVTSFGAIRSGLVSMGAASAGPAATVSAR
jgi:uncharacterized integral membrane protein (TIGR00698 family)